MPVVMSEKYKGFQGFLICFGDAGDGLVFCLRAAIFFFWMTWVEFK